MANPRDHSMLVRAARLYYIEGLSQAEVADAIGVTRSNVSRVLADARRHGIVEIRVHDPFGRSRELEQALLERYPLRECRVAPAGDHDVATTRVGSLGAEWLTANLPVDGAIAVSWGTAVQAVVDAVPSGSRHPDIEVLPLVGGLSSVDSARDANVLVRALAARLGSAHRRLYAPAVVDSAQSRDAILGERSIGEVLDAARTASVAVVGIGAVGSGASSAIIESMHLSTADAAAFAATGAVGDCCTRFIDENGQPVPSAVDDRVIAVTIDDLLRMPTVVGVAAGRQKTAGVHAALMGSIIDVLVVDSELAEALLALPRR